MAKIPDKNAATYPKERDGFLRDLHHFHETRGTPFRRPPILGGKEVDLHLLYTLVTSQGGWIKVNSKNGWTEILDQLRLPKECVNGSVALKQIYLRYLDRWEKVHFLGEEADRGSDDDEESRHKRWSARALHSVPLTYNYNQHVIADTNREYNHLSTNIYKSSDYDRLALSLISPLPNEQDFAINVCTLLSNDGKHTLKLDKHPRIVDYLLAHAGVFCHSSLRRLFVHSYSTIRKHPIHNFWSEVLESKEFLDLTDENSVFIKSEGVDSSESANCGLPKIVEEKCDSDSDCEITDNKRFKITPSDRELFCLERGLGTQDYIGQRVLQVTTILRNLSFIEENVLILLQNKTFLRFLLLCASSRWGYLKNLGLDMLGNIATEFLVKDYPNDRLAAILLKIIVKGLKSEDRALCISSLEVLNKLSQNELNEETLLRFLEVDVYEKVCSFLTIHDVMLLIYTLECLYSLSSLGERSCNLIVSNHGVVDTLVSLVTVEGKSYGPKACIGMKLVETLPGGVSTTASQAITTPAATTTNSTVANTSTTTTATSAVLSTITAVKTSVQTTPVRTVQITPQRLLTISPSSSTVTTTPTTPAQTMTPQQLIQQQHAHQQAIHENEQFALAWLRATYEPCVNGKVDHQELYKQYLNSCSKIGRRGVISPLHFPRCVRSVFGGTVGPNPMKPSSANEPQYYEGIKVRAQPLIINIQPASTNPVTPPPQPTSTKGSNRRNKQTATTSPSQTPTLTVMADNSNSNDTMNNPPVSPASPILKAQLSAPPKQRDATVASPPTSKGDMKSQVMAHPHLSQALLGSNSAQTTAGSSKDNQAGQSNTSLIKSLLATKVNDCMTTVSMRTATDCQNVAQVVARQQKLLAQQVNATTATTTTTSTTDKTPVKTENQKSRLNGARQLFPDGEVGDPSVSSTTQFTNMFKGKKEPPQPPPPLAPLSNNKKSSRIDNEDSDSTGNNSLASSSGVGTICIGGISSTEDGDNSLTSFEGILNGIPNIDNPLNEDSNSKDSIKVGGEILKNKPLRLADLLEKKVEKTPPTMMNGTLGKELRLDLVENHIEKALSRENENHEEDKKSVKRTASEEIVESEPKKAKLNVNGSAGADSPAPDSVSSSNGDESSTQVSTAAAKLFADIAADILEGEDEEQLMQEASNPPPVEQSPVATPSTPVQQLLVDNNQQVLLTQPRQIIVSQPKTQTGQTVIVQNAGQQRTPMVLQQNTGQILLSQGLQGQVQLVASTTQPGQYVLQTSGTQGTYMVAQPQTAVVHGQPQTVLVAQTAQQQGSGTKTIIILQQQPSSTQKVVLPQGQQMVVTQVHRPVLQSSTVTNNVVPTTSVIKTTPSSGTSNGVVEKKEEKPKIIRDLTTPFVCEWGDCNVDTKFKSANQVYLHVCEAHVPKGSEEIVCQWDRCDNMKRKRFSLMTHLNDKHCNTEAMKQSLTRRKQVSQGGKVEPPPPAPTSHPGYAPDAALHAIKRHALEFVNPKELQDDNEGPVTKSIRLTASLILRNLVIYSSNCRRYLKHYEPHLANVALSNVESSRTIAQVLYDMNEGSNHR
ncbi:AT-rich interactive domain-containing protein 2 isoform X3 [Tribolium madens]|uniref:AT-rich interactive domain-containing protein 2 isoform X3 n=1 Tax=Tribolium madens TaxID=41895 RepID=UPI001CF7423C|nr:AT-rich interactive domain-containing protein 2 isoform X3 [Tribolium madens]